MDLRELESLYDEFAPAGYAFALQLTRDSDAAQDLVQSVFLRLARRPRFTILNPRSFVLRCTYRAHVDVVRRDATRRQMLENFAWETRGQGSFSFIFSDTKPLSVSGIFFSISDKSMRWIALLAYPSLGYRFLFAASFAVR
jgi:predicted RNA polymerase sigma factor